jgi:DNA-binding MarR family transcriptional regulator
VVFCFQAIRDKDDPRSQRSLSRDMGIALGLTNLIIRRLVHKGWVRIIRIKPNRVRYLLTPAGIAELSSRLVSGGVR